MKYERIFLLALSLVAACPLKSGAVSAQERPNVLWISSEDHGPQMGCYGDVNARTPNVDKLAAGGMLFKHAWSCAPVCAPARTTIITGMYPPSLGAEHMRSMVPLPSGKSLFPQFLRQEGYYCTNNSKEDYNVTKLGEVWDHSSAKAHWKNRAPGQPFFAVFNSTVTHESQINRDVPLNRDPAAVRVPAYHPDTPEVRRDWARYYDAITEADSVAGKHLAELEQAGLAEDTIVFYWADHGSGMPRSKRWPCDSGLHVPLVVYFPAKWKHLAPKEYAPGSKSDRLVSFVDFAPTVLSLAGIKPPDWMQGFAFAGSFQTDPQPFIYGFRGRMDERPDIVRSVTDGRFVYLRNYMIHRSQGQHVNTQFKTKTTELWWNAFASGKATEAQSLFWKTPKDPEELYDLESDPDEVHNLASESESQEVLVRLRIAQQNLARRVRDTGFLTEGEVYQRSEKDSPYTMARDAARYDFERVFAAAEIAASKKEEALPQLLAYLRDKDSAVRYWGALGILMRGEKAVEDVKFDLISALADPNPSVRIPVAEALGRYGNGADLQSALVTLQDVVDPGKTNYGTSIAAMNALDALGEKIAPLVGFLTALSANDPSASARNNGYVSRLQGYLLERFNLEIPRIPGEGNARGKSVNDE